MSLSLAWAASAASAQGTRPDGAPPGPPPKAVAACNGKAAGATVSFQGHRGETVTGVCEQIGAVLAARPAGGKPMGAAQ
ncbi:hypothetical protein [Xylophilus sp. GOD-11R]|uniref:hypothetical protein n=1 Tax=Xylophilus sp. GOD-11R TaxID=3089814 RepID=UPI00298D4D08|nr:hypothetical protein [Xylophilus sp. GOD-11R]WPB57537.1 hypothetical protein R9X41_02445 [Xylophilus sp. GOD-11R]